MLQYIFGRAFTGKTQKIISLLKEEEKVLKSVKNNEENDIFLIVPEQYSFETEKALVENGLNDISVTSFTRLINIVENIYGGNAGKTLTAADKIIIMSRVLQKVKGSLSLYKKSADSFDFAENLVLFNDELKNNDIGLDEFVKVLPKISNKAFYDKTNEIIEILTLYNSVTEKKFLLSENDLEHLYNIINNNGFFKGKTVYFDAFKDFTGAQYKIIDNIFKYAKKVAISFCYDKDMSDEFSIFNIVKENILKINTIAKKYGHNILPDIVLKNNYYKHEDLKFLEKSLLTVNNQKLENNENLYLINAKNKQEEVFCVLSEAARLVREENYRYRDFVIIARDISEYENLLMPTAQKFNIPLFLDQRKELTYSPIFRLAVNILTAAKKYSTDDIFNMLNCGFDILTEKETEAIYNYVYIWQINGMDWIKNWDMNPNGFEPINDDNKKEAIIKKLEFINGVRIKIVNILNSLNFAVNYQKNNILQELYNTLQKLDIPNKFNELSNKLPKDICYLNENYCRQSYDAFIDLLSSVNSVLKDEDFTAEDIINALKIGAENIKIGVVPQLLDEISCGSADRIRPGRPKIVFLLGLNSGEFPKISMPEGLFLTYEKERFKDLGLDFPNGLQKFITNEKFLVYSCAASAGDKIYFCNTQFNGNGDYCEESSVLTELKKIIDFKKINTNLLGVETPKSAFSAIKLNKSNKNDIIYALKKSEDFKDYNFNFKSSFDLEDEKVKDIIKNEINLSASQIERYYNCNFSYFCRYILKLKKQQKAEIDVINRGTIVHYVLENIINKYKEDIKDLTIEQIRFDVNSFMNEYLNGIVGSDFIKTPRFIYLYKKIEKITVTVVKHISDEFKVCKFKPEYCELDVGKDIPPLILYNGKIKIVVKGKIDRTDILEGFNNDNYVRIVDYKTGKKDVNLYDLLYGLNLQMLIYLNAVIKNGNKLKGYNLKPAGVLYLNAKSDLRTESRENDEILRMDGILLNDYSVQDKMDFADGYKFIPKKPLKANRKSNPNISEDDFNTVFKNIDSKIINMVKEIKEGNIKVNPVTKSDSENTACKYCDFKDICKLDNKETVLLDYKALTNEEILEQMKKESAFTGEENKNGF